MTDDEIYNHLAILQENINTVADALLRLSRKIEKEDEHRELVIKDGKVTELL
jgi:hypothetical protein